jgi:toxin CcdB
VAQFDVYRSAGDGTLLVDCQSEMFDHFKTRFVIPLLPSRGKPALDRLHPIFEVQGEPHLLATPLASAVGLGDMGTKVASLTNERHTILNAIDMLLTGY